MSPPVPQIGKHVYPELYAELAGAAFYLSAMGDRYSSLILESYSRNILRMLDPPPERPAEPVSRVDYKALPTACDISAASLEWCLTQGLKPSLIFTLHVAPLDGCVVEARNVIRKLNADTAGHPFAPLIQVRTNEHLRVDQWYVEDEHQNRVGSRGIG